MSIPVSMADLPNEIVRRGPGFLLSSVFDSRPHAANLRFEVAAADGQVQLRAKAGNTASHNVGQRPSVTVLFPAGTFPPYPKDKPAPQTADDHSLIIDGEARLDADGHVIISVTNAVYHRPAPE